MMATMYTSTSVKCVLMTFSTTTWVTTEQRTGAELSRAEQSSEERRGGKERAERRGQRESRESKEIAERAERRGQWSIAEQLALDGKSLKRKRDQEED